MIPQPRKGLKGCKENAMGYISACAWCERVKVDGRYTETKISDIKLKANQLITSGICAECAKTAFK